MTTLVRRTLILFYVLFSVGAHANTCEFLFAKPNVQSNSSYQSVTRHITFLAEAISYIVRNNSSEWTDCRGRCIPLSYRLYGALNKYHGDKLLLERAYYSGPADYAPRSMSTHAYVVDRTLGEPIIIDPTYLQFLSGGAGLGLPAIFIGTREDLVRLIQKHQDYLSPPIPVRNSMSIDVEKFVDQTWPLQAPARGTYEVESNR